MAIAPCRRGFEDMHFAVLEATHWLLVAATLLVSVRTLLHWQWKHPQNRSIPECQAPNAPSASAPARPPLRELDPWVGQVLLLNMATAIHSAATVRSRSHRHPWHDKAPRIPAHCYSVHWENDRSPISMMQSLCYCDYMSRLSPARRQRWQHICSGLQNVFRLIPSDKL